MLIIYNPRKVSGNGHEYIIDWACSYPPPHPGKENQRESELILETERDIFSFWFLKFESKFYILIKIHSVITPNVYIQIS